MVNRRNPIYHYIFYALLVIEILIVLFVAFQRQLKIDLQNEALYLMNENWIFHVDNGNLQSLTLPAITDAGEDNTVIISNKIPDTGENLSSIGILTTHQSIIASIDEQVIYSRLIPKDNSRFFDIPAGSVWDIIPLKPDSQGKTLTLVLSSKYPAYAGRINEVHIGTKSSILIHTIRMFGLGFILSVIICLMGSFLIYLYLLTKKLFRADKSIYYLGWFSVISGIWLLMENSLTQLFYKNAFLNSTISHLALMTLAIPILLYVNLLPNYHFKKLNTINIYILLFSNLLFILLQFFNILDFYEAMPFIRVILLLTLGSGLISLWLELIKYRNKEVKVFTIASLTLFVSSVIEVYNYQSQTEHIKGEYFRIGFYCFLFILAWDGFKKIVDCIKLSERATHYRQLAYRDSLTNCRNRIAYERDIKKLDTEREITIFMTDMNNMKEINDTYGHQIGDEVIILCSQCLLKVFGRSVYRIGGDEFLIIQYGLTPENINNMLQSFQEECKKANEDIAYPFALSIGYASYDPLTDMTIHETIKRADNNMYLVKEQMKKNPLPA